MRRNKPFRVGEKVQKRRFRSPSLRANVGWIRSIKRLADVGGRAAVVGFADGSEQLVMTSDLKRLK